MCPFELGRLRELYRFSWDGVTNDGLTGAIDNGTQGRYWLTEEDNRTLHVNISAVGHRRNFECVGAVQTCMFTGSTSCTTQRRNSPTITIINNISKPLCGNLKFIIVVFFGHALLITFRYHQFIVPLALSFAARPSIVESPTNVMVNEGDPATFTCSATGSGELTIEWSCSASDGTDCGSCTNEEGTDGRMTSTYMITRASASLNVTCVVSQSLASFMSESNIETRLPEPLMRRAELTVIPGSVNPSSGEQK